MGFAESLAAMAVFSDEAMATPWVWRPGGEPLGVRDIFHRALEAELAQLSLAESGRRRGETEVAMAQAGRAFGNLLGLLAGQPAALLDEDPGGGEWALRRVLHHVLEVELSFSLNVRWAITRGTGDALRPPDEMRRRETAAPSHGSLGEITSRLEVARAATDGLVESLQPAQLDLPTSWVNYEVDVRFRVHRFASHLVEHTIQVEKILHSLERDPLEARQEVRAIWSVREAHRRHSQPAALEALDAAIAERLASVRELPGA
jgi:hypothetical protein